MKNATQEEVKTIVPTGGLATEYLANERTFLAWVRTAVSIIALGFVVSKFSLWLEEMALISPRLGNCRTGTSVPLGVVMMFFVGVLIVLAAWRYHVVNRQIECGEFGPTAV